MVRNEQSKGRWQSPVQFGVSVLFLVGLSACGGTSPYEDLGSKADLIRAAQTATPLPPGSHYDPKSFETQANATYERGYFVAMAQSEAQCKWYMYWLSGFAAHDTPKMNQATQAFSSMHSWTFYAQTDPGTRNLYDSIVQSATLGDSSAMQHFVDQNCPGITP